MSRLRCRLSARLDEAPAFNNTMSFGIAVEGFPNCGSRSIGEVAGSWGLYNNRSSSSEPSKICACGTVVDSFRALKVGDILTMECDKITGSATLSVNYDEYRHVFSLPINDDVNFVIGATFCNDHTLTIITSLGGDLTHSRSNKRLSSTKSSYMLLPGHVKQRVSRNHFPSCLKSLYRASKLMNSLLFDEIPEVIVNDVLRPLCEQRQRSVVALDYSTGDITKTIAVPGALGYRVEIDKMSVLSSGLIFKMEGTYPYVDRHCWAPDSMEFHYFEPKWTSSPKLDEMIQSAALSPTSATRKNIQSLSVPGEVSDDEPCPGDVVVRGESWWSERDEDGGPGGLGDVVSVRRVKASDVAAGVEIAVQVWWRASNSVGIASELPWYRYADGSLSP